MNAEIITLKIRFLLRTDGQIVVPTDDKNEIKTFLFKCNVDWLKEIDVDSKDFAEDLSEKLRKDLYFCEFLIQLFREKFDLFLASISFELENKEYIFGDVAEDYSYWIWNQEPRITIDEEYGRIEMDIYQFDEYENCIGIDKTNYEFNLFGKTYDKNNRF